MLYLLEELPQQLRIFESGGRLHPGADVDRERMAGCDCVPDIARPEAAGQKDAPARQPPDGLGDRFIAPRRAGPAVEGTVRRVEQQAPGVFIRSERRIAGVAAA